ncbi:GAF domain-containing protein [Dactylosporangium vinaceum]|uniref:GAF domain-containing protein n=1 Tax=Dactylosporangium vinaceum TaxID=53362 RepID=A0ABV5MDT2_9ACTN|nr:GAF domain-containing protein [Dactylosporangium vinaceum]UAC01061.1 GAF domain-containing protein [Dactylosporangium vinaceum]
MLGTRDEPSEHVAQLLRQARKSLGLSLAFITRMDGTTQHVEVVEPRVPPLLRDNHLAFPDETTICRAILAGRLPALMPDMRDIPEAMALPAVRKMHLRAFVSVPIHLADGTFYGTLCAAGFRPATGLGPEHEQLMRDLADATAEIIEPGARGRLAEDALRARIEVATAEEARLLLDPVVHLTGRRRIGACAAALGGEHPEPLEALLAAARNLGEQDRIAVRALRRVGSILPRTAGYVALPVAAATLRHKPFVRTLAALPLGRIVLECAADELADDPEAAAHALEPLRAAGLRLTVRTAGPVALGHLQPELVKLESPAAAAAGPLIEEGPVRPRLVAAGVDSEADAAALPDLGVQRGQGRLFGPPVLPELLRDSY